MPIDDETLALIELNRLARGDECPALDAAEQLDILAKFKRGSLWATATVYQIGALIIPTAANRNGCRFRAVRYTAVGTDQKTGATEPVWSTTRDAEITDNHIVWVEDGWDWDGTLWDFQGAAEEAWKTKAGKTVGRVNFATAQGISVDASQLYDHCIAQAKQFHRSICL